MIKRILIKLYSIVTKVRYYRNPFKKYDILFFDTIFPNPLSGFRAEEFTNYLYHYNNSKIITNPLHYPVLKQTIQDFKKDVSVFKTGHPTIVKKFQVAEKFNNINTQFLYCVFYCNMIQMLPYVNKYRIPFAFTLYPGGGFNLDNETVLANLKKICSSPFFRGVIVTQKITKDYLIKNKICTDNQIHYIFGGIVPQNSMNVVRQNYYGQNKETLDICFCANKYMPKGLDKGYDIFVGVAKKLIKKHQNIRFHVVGDFNKDDIELEETTSHFLFHGKMPFEQLQNVFLQTDLILSPNRPNVLSKGAFDGFPLGTVVEAALNGAIPIITDELHQNDAFKDNEVYIVKPTIESFVSIIENLIENVDFQNQSNKTQQKFRDIYNNKVQLSHRIKILDDLQ